MTVVYHLSDVLKLLTLIFHKEFSVLSFPGSSFKCLTPIARMKTVELTYTLLMSRFS